MKKMISLFVLALSLLLLTGCLVGPGNTDVENPHMSHTDSIWVIDQDTVTCNRQRAGESFTVMEICSECGEEVVNTVTIPCTEFVIHQPDENGYCSACGCYAIDFEAPNTVMWVEDGTEHTVSRGDGVLSHVEKTGDQTLETYYIYDVEDGYFVYPDEITQKTYKNGRITGLRTLTYENSDEFSLLRDELNEVYSHTVFYVGQIFERTSGDEYIATYSYGSVSDGSYEEITFAIPIFTYSGYEMNDDGSRGEKVSTDVSFFNRELFSFTKMGADGWIEYDLIKDAPTPTVPQKPEDDFFLALAKLESFEIFCDEEYTVNRTETQTYDAQTMSALTVIASDKNVLKLEMESQNITYYFEARDDDIYLTVVNGTTKQPAEKVEGEFTEVAVSSTLYGMYTLINGYLERYEFTYGDGVATFTDPEHASDYVHVYVEDGVIVRMETYSETEYEGKPISATVDFRIVYGEVDVTLP